MTRSDYIKILDEQLQLLIEEQNESEDIKYKAGCAGRVCELVFRIMCSVPDSSREEY